MKNQLDFLARWESEKLKSSGRSVYATPKYVSLYVSAALLLILLATSPWLYGLKQDRDLIKLETKISDLVEVQQKVNELESLKNQVAQSNEVLETYYQSTYDPYEVFQKIMPLLPMGTTISSLTIQEDYGIQLNLNLSTPVDVTRLWVSFEESGLFESVDINTVSLQDMPQALTLDLRFLEQNKRVDGDDS